MAAECGTGGTKKRKRTNLSTPVDSKKQRIEDDFPVGSVGTLRSGQSEAKYRFVKLGFQDVRTAWEEIKVLPFFPVSLSTVNLNKTLFDSNKSFSGVKKSDIGVELHLNEVFPLGGICSNIDDPTLKEIAIVIKGLILQMFPLNIEMIQPQIVCDKEGKDREIVVQALASLLDFTDIVCYNEPKIITRDESKVIHGELDLLIGEGGNFESNHIVILTDDGYETIQNPAISETKSGVQSLATTKLNREKTIVNDLSHTIQPIVQLLFMGQMQSDERSHIVLFYMSRYKVRPYIYFPHEDVILATKRAYVWRTDDRLAIRGCTLISVLLRLNHLLRRSSTLLADKKTTKTNFLSACNEAKFDVKEHCRLKRESKKLLKDSLVEDIREELEELEEYSDSDLDRHKIPLDDSP